MKKVILGYMWLQVKMCKYWRYHKTARAVLCKVTLQENLYSVASARYIACFFGRISSELLPQDTSVMIAERHTIFFSFSSGRNCRLW